MKKFNVMILLTILALFLAACSGGNANEDRGTTNGDEAALAYEPEAIDPEVDVCELCAMAVADDQHATQIVLKNDRSLKFDDIGCLYGWVEENGEDEIGAKFVRDFHTEEWVLLEDATFVFDEQIDTPMAYGIISFKNKEDAEAYIEDHGFGELLTVDDLENHKWEMMKHDHDHHS